MWFHAFNISFQSRNNWPDLTTFEEQTYTSLTENQTLLPGTLSPEEWNNYKSKQDAPSGRK